MQPPSFYHPKLTELIHTTSYIFIPNYLLSSQGKSVGLQVGRAVFVNTIRIFFAFLYRNEILLQNLLIEGNLNVSLQNSAYNGLPARHRAGYAVT